MYFIYKCTNNKNKMSYIGQTTNFEYRKSIHLKSKNQRLYFQQELQKKPLDFKWYVIDECKTQDEANILERKYIKMFDTIYPKGYNIRSGGSQNKKGTVVLQYDLQGNFLNEFNNVTTASLETDTSRTSIMGCLQGVYKKGNNFIWIKKGQEHLLKEKVKNAPIQGTVIQQIDNDGNVIEEYISCTQAEKTLGLRPKAYKVIWSKLDTNTKCYGFYWKRKKVQM